MSIAAEQGGVENGTHLTMTLAEQAAGLQWQHLSPEAVQVARQCLADWFAVTLAGAREPLTGILLEDVAEEGGKPQATLLGAGAKGTERQAALVNGSASHALDYDDVNLSLSGHPTVGVAAALLAMAESRGLSGRDLLTAFVAGYEAECRIGMLVGPSHYAKGFHVTATVGAIGAAAAAARLLNLDAERTAAAMGIAATQAAGLKSQFGTMCKPLHAGKAAETGVLSARLAARGFTSRTDILETAQGFAATQSDDFHADRALLEPRGGFFIRENLFKYHAACYLTHSTIEILRDMRRDQGVTPDAVEAVELSVDPGHFKVCHIPEPQTGLEVKFSLRHTAAMALSGDDTGDAESYTDELAQRPDLVALRRKVAVEPSGGPRTLASASVTLKDGRTLNASFDVGVPAADLDGQQRKVEGKFHSLCRPLLGEAGAAALLADINRLEMLEDAGALLRHCEGFRA